ncbi:Ankyrin repeat protein [Penicillium canescens]|uniref:Ankyrin repeat protein n=1 Tax=Penicillium canescens TaxID=5083 RepID=A0AAD6I645_PENCN|nr:Ankyrin repeat protein [Penicillium canescens]KAJ6018506.1 Ankyrin repeat protein [Penicillium canescens]KAJ6034113.1 Ankyrin repeat protein [Penicillium canescens]KAJ6039322.1 Ankyrin repeat protein [Penicillium canescens]KAJ6066160.1 Ankyrin repeat protein [Penicillium canescens]KAJ6091149.1 Ankyrin repeat protein [Penicillium canescens]
MDKLPLPLFKSNLDRTVALYHAICIGSLDLIKQITDLPHLIAAIDEFNNFGDDHVKGGYFAGDEKAFAASNFGGYVSPLIVAINNRNVESKHGMEIIQFLLDAGADPNTPDRFHRNLPLFVAASKGDHELASLLLDNKADQFIYSIEGSLILRDGSLRESHWKKWKLLVPLDAAMRGGYIELAELLIERGEPST